MTVTLAAKMYVGTAAFISMNINYETIQVSCSSNNCCKVLGDFIEVCGDAYGKMNESGLNSYTRDDDDDRGCAFFKPPTGRTALALVEENAGD